MRGKIKWSRKIWKRQNAYIWEGLKCKPIKLKSWVNGKSIINFLLKSLQYSLSPQSFS